MWGAWIRTNMRVEELMLDLRGNLTFRKEGMNDVLADAFGELEYYDVLVKHVSIVRKRDGTIRIQLRIEKGLDVARPTPERLGVEWRPKGCELDRRCVRIEDARMTFRRSVICQSGWMHHPDCPTALAEQVLET